MNKEKMPQVIAGKCHDIMQELPRLSELIQQVDKYRENACVKHLQSKSDVMKNKRPALAR
jgi:hypothetical protein